MPWRTDPNAYNVFVSEVMLQQTQVPRVLPKFAQFTTQFPNFETLAKADLGQVLREWNGLGYNRRAKFLWQAAQEITKHGFPNTAEDLTKLPGIGPNTASAIIAYVYDQPAVFIETNIRTVFIHHFFKTQAKVGDPEVRTLVEAALPAKNIRQWYWALMDYGTFLKNTAGTQLEKVKSYKKQSAFNGSNRQVRGMVVRLLTKEKMDLQALQTQVNDDRLLDILKDLQSEGLVKKSAAGIFTI